MGIKIKTHDLDEIIDLLDIMESAESVYCTTDYRRTVWDKLYRKLQDGKIKIDA